MRESALKILFALTFLLLIYNYSADITSGILAYYNEGPLLDQAMRLVHGENIYRADIQNPPYIINNYGPLYTFLQWPFLKSTGPTSFFGDIISLACHLASAWFAGLIMKKFTESNYARGITTLLVLAAPLVGGGMPLYRVDLLAQALSMAGMYVGLFSKHRKNDIVTAALCTATVYTKLTYGLCGPATIFFFHLLQGDRKTAFRQAFILVWLCLLLLVVTQWLTNGGFIFNILTANLMDYSPLRALGYLKIAIIQSTFAFCVIPVLWEAKNLPRQTRLFCILYLIFACIAAMAAGKIGANYGYFSEFQIALAFIAALSQKNLIVWGQTALYLYFLAISPYHHYVRDNRAAITGLKDIIKAEPGIIIADDYMGLLALTGKPLYFEPFEMTQLHYSGLWPQDALLAELRGGKFSMILMGEYNLRKERWTPQMLDAITSHYYLAQSSTRLVEIWRRR